MATSERYIAIIGFDVLQHHAISELIHRNYDYMVVDSCDDSTITDFIDAYIISSDIFVSRFDFFMTKRSKSLIICENPNTIGPDLSVSIIGLNSSISEIEDAISKLIYSLDNEAVNSSELSSREKDVLKEIASGKIIKEIADTLNISVNTVLTHRKNISTKLGIRSVSGLSLYALMNGIIK